MKELVEVITKALVDDPDGVAVTERQDGRTTVIEVRVADGDMQAGTNCKSDPFRCQSCCGKRR